MFGSSRGLLWRRGKVKYWAGEAHGSNGLCCGLAVFQATNPRNSKAAQLARRDECAKLITSLRNS